MSWPLLKNSLLIGGCTVVFATAFGLIAAVWLTGLPRRHRMLMLGVAVVSFALPPFLVTNCWLDVLGVTGTWKHWLPLDIVSPAGTIWILSLLLWPITLLAALSAWARIQSHQLESDTALTGWKLISNLLFPMARTALTQSAVLTFVLAINNFTVPAILQVKVLPAEIWVRFNATLSPGALLVRSWPLLVIPLILLICFARSDFAWPQLARTVSPHLFRRQLGSAWFAICGITTLLICFLSAGLPLLQLISLKRTWTELPGAIAANQAATWNSFWFATVAALIVTGLGLASVTRGSFASLRSQIPERKAGLSLEPLIWLPILVPGVVLGLFLIFVFNRPGLLFFYRSSGIVILAFVIRYFALGWNGVKHASRGVDRDLMDDARLNGASEWQTIRFVLFPQIAPQLAAAAYIIFLLCLWDVESMLLVWPPGGETLALSIFNLLHYGHNAQVNALCLTLLLLALTPLIVCKLVAATRRLPFLRYKTCLASCVCCSLLLIASGCSMKQSANDAPLNSQIFSAVQVIGHRGVGVGELNKPRSVAVDSKDNVYVVDMTGRVQKFSPQGAFLLLWQLPQTDLGNPKGMTRDGSGNILVIEPHYQRVNHFTQDGTAIGQWGMKGTNAGQFMLPRAVAVNSRGEIYVSEYGAVERVQRFRVSPESPSTAGPSKSLATDGKLVVEFVNGFGLPGTDPGYFNRPEGLCVDSKDQVYVADSCNHRIQIFSSEGKFIRTYGKAGSAAGELSYPYDICVDAAGRQYVCEFGNSRIQVFDSNDRSIEIIGGAGAQPGHFANPWGVALDSAGNLYVADSQNHRIQKLIRDPKAEPKTQKPVAMSEQPGTTRHAPLVVVHNGRARHSVRALRPDDERRARTE
jgi:ABC-type Fe3+ transport system permease subunit/DNA-binding beta-propeller fold protein YncE